LFFSINQPACLDFFLLKAVQKYFHLFVWSGREFQSGAIKKKGASAFHLLSLRGIPFPGEWQKYRVRLSVHKGAYRSLKSP